MTVTQTLTQRRSAAVAPAPTSDKEVYTGGVQRVPTAKPPFTVGDIRRAIPAHCFTRPLSKSFGYLFWDLFLVAVLVYATTFIPQLSDERLGGLGPWARAACWVVYWICQGAVCTGLWVIGHECGHGGFADNTILNHGVGLIIHSCLLVPYFAWQISHRRHHSNTGSIEHDEVFVPALASKEEVEKHRAKMSRLAAGEQHVDEDGALTQLFGVLHRIFFLVIMMTLGWPGYLLANLSGNKSYDPSSWVNHFAPSSPIFRATSDPHADTPQDKHNRTLIVVSDVALLTVVAVLYKWVQLTSLSNMVCLYFIPYLIVNFWLVLITYLQHTDLALPHYTDGEWDWLRGALATVDRDYGILNVVFHHITDTHVVHHLFSPMPHYHAMEATEAVKPLLGEYYRFDDTPVFTSLWRSFRDCNVVYPDEKQQGVHWFN